MKKIFITGSTTGLGILAGEILKKEGHEVILHARTAESKMQKGFSYVIGDLENLEEMKSVAEQANKFGPFDAVIHNAGVYVSPKETIFKVNVLAPYVLTKLMTTPERLIYLSSGMHLSGDANFKNPNYSDSKLLVRSLTNYFARTWEKSYVNAVDPGWVPTRMGGAGAPDDLGEGAETQSWLSISNDPAALVSGKYFHHLKQHKSNPLADSIDVQEKLVSYLKEISGI
jgi:NAD(P)-dependent dehydrogenase (short-subunit alcohol dehydrogenase family)